MERIRSRWRGRPHKGWRVIAVLVIAYFLVARFGLWVIIDRANTAAALGNFNQSTQALTGKLAARVEDYANILYAGRGLFVADQNVTRQGWTNFIEAQRITQRYPAIYGASYVTSVPSSQTAGFIRQLNANRLPTEATPFTVFPAVTGNQLAVITYIAPASNEQQTIGYNLLSDLSRSKALEQARDSGQPVATTPLSLVGNNPAAGFLVALATYKDGMPTTDPDTRQVALQGYVVLVLHTQPLLDGIFKAADVPATMGVTVATGGKAIYQSGTVVPSNTLRKTVSMDVAGQNWQLSFAAPDSFGLNGTATSAQYAVLVSSIPILIIFGLMAYYAITLDSLRRYHDEHHERNSLDHEH